MAQASFITKVGSTADSRPSGSDVIVVSEPEVGATLRTKGRFYFLCEVSPPGAALSVAREIADLARQEYYYDLSAGIEVSLRRALRQANRRAAQRLREQRGHPTLHVACALIVNNELYAARVGAAQVFLVRRARLFLPGDEPGELADFVHRSTTREASSLGVQADVLPKVWRQAIESGDTVILASGALVDGLGAEALKSAAVTLHPRAAAEHVHNRAVADGVIGSDAAVFVEIAQSSGAAARLSPQPEPMTGPQEAEIAESIRARVDSVWSRRPQPGRLLRDAAAPARNAVSKAVAVGLELMPRRGVTLPRHPDTARERSRRQRRAVTTLAVALLVVAAGVGALAYRDYESTRVVREYQTALVSTEDAIASAHRLADRKPPDLEGARGRIGTATAMLDEAARSPMAQKDRIAALRVELVALTDQIDGVVLDLSRVSPDTKPAQLVGTVNGLYAADPGAGRLWRVFGTPAQAAAVLERGARGVAAPTMVAAQGEALYSPDDAGKLWRAEGDQIRDVTPLEGQRVRTASAIAVFSNNLYLLDPQSGQLWKYESNDGVTFRNATGYLAPALPTNTARSLAVDGDVWIVTSAGEILRYRRNLLASTAARIDFQPRWIGDPAHPTAIQALDTQDFLYVLDATGRQVLQLGRDGRELARFSLPPTLSEPSAFYVSETQHMAYTLHGARIVGTSISR